MKFYVILKGRKTGVFYSWNEAKEYINGVDAVYKAWGDKSAAKAWAKELGWGINFETNTVYCLDGTNIIEGVKFYVLLNGPKAGIYHDWGEVVKAKTNVNNALYKKFRFRADAKAWANEKGYDIDPKTGKIIKLDKTIMKQRKQARYDEKNKIFIDMPTNEDIQKVRGIDLSKPVKIGAGEVLVFELSDIAFHVDEVIKAIDLSDLKHIKHTSPFSGNTKEIKLMYVMTKNVTKNVEKLLRLPIPRFLYVSITGMGKTPFEPFVPEWRQEIKALENLIKEGFDPKDIAVRIDPIYPGVNSPDTEKGRKLIADIIKEVHRLGIPQIITSVLDIYDNTNEYVKKAIDMSVYKGGEKTDGNALNANKEYLTKIFGIIQDLINKEVNGEVEQILCGESPSVMPKGTRHIGCLNKERIEKTLKQKVIGIKDRDVSMQKAQRSNCLCAVTLDGKKLKRQALTSAMKCNHGCAVCYVQKNAIVKQLKELVESKELNMKKQIIRIPMNFKDGDDGRSMRKEFAGKSTMQLIMSGDRTATSRDWNKPYNVVNVKPGDQIVFYDKLGNEVLCEVTKAPYPVEEITAEEWSKLEGWATSGYERIKGKGYKQFRFKLIKIIKKAMNENGCGIKFIECKMRGYQPRTKENAKAADITIAIAKDFSSYGEIATRKATLDAGKIYKGYILKLGDGTKFGNKLVGLLRDKFGDKPIKINFAGNGIYTLVKYNVTQEKLDEYLRDALKVVKESGLNIVEIRSGGQTGVDEAAAKAARDNGFNTVVLAPNGWGFRPANGKDIWGNKKAFIARFCTIKIEQNNMKSSHSSEKCKEIKWARIGNGYEVSSAGDKRFSALYAKLSDGRTIEEAYQLDVKGYRKEGNDWRLGKGKPPLIKMTKDESWAAYLELWKKWALENKELIEELRKLAAKHNCLLTDKFASTEISQARALAEILNNGVQENKIDAYVDGSWLNKEKSGWGYVLVKDNKKVDECWGPVETKYDNNNTVGEVFGAIYAIKKAKELGYNHIVIHHDYEGVGKWADGIWKAKKEHSKLYREFVKKGREEFGLLIEFVWVKGHSGDTWNEYVDGLAKRGAQLYGTDIIFGCKEQKQNKQKEEKDMNKIEQVILDVKEELKKVLGTNDIDDTLVRFVTRIILRKGDYMIKDLTQIFGYYYGEAYDYMVKEYAKEDDTSKFETKLITDKEIFEQQLKIHKSNITGPNDLKNKAYYKAFLISKVIVEMKEKYKDLAGTEVEVRDFKQDSVGADGMTVQPLLKINNRYLRVRTYLEGILGGSKMTISPEVTETRIIKFSVNTKQKEAMEKLYKFIKTPKNENERPWEFRLQGFAGAGKTFVITSIIKLFPETHFYFTAPTHRAASVLRAMLAEKGLDKYPVTTIHDFLSLIPSDEKEGEFIRKGGIKIDIEVMTVDSNKILIIDEAEMLDDKIYEILRSEQQIDKIIFVGDPAQLPPVSNGVTMAKAVNITDEDNGIMLDQVMRTGDNYLLQESMYVRKHKVFSYVTRMKDGKGVIFETDISKFIKQFVDLYKSNPIEENPFNVRMITGTNKAVIQFNKTIREALFGKDAENEYNVGELLMGYNNLGGIHNGLDYIITHIEETEATLITDDVVEGYLLGLRRLYDGKEFEVFAPKRSVFTFEFNESLKAAYDAERGKEKRKWKMNFFDMGAIVDNVYKPILLKYNLKLKNGNTFLKKNINYGYVLTIHKAIGGTYDYIFVNDIDINKFPDKDTRVKARYVAVTRAKNYAVILSDSISNKEPEKIETSKIKMVEASFETAATIRKNELTRTKAYVPDEDISIYYASSKNDRRIVFMYRIIGNKGTDEEPDVEFKYCKESDGYVYQDIIIPKDVTDAEVNLIAIVYLLSEIVYEYKLYKAKVYNIDNLERLVTHNFGDMSDLTAGLREFLKAYKDTYGIEYIDAYFDETIEELETMAKVFYNNDAVDMTMPQPEDAGIKNDEQQKDENKEEISKDKEEPIHEPEEENEEQEEKMREEDAMKNDLAIEILSAIDFENPRRIYVVQTEEGLIITDETGRNLHEKGEILKFEDDELKQKFLGFLRSVRDFKHTTAMAHIFSVKFGNIVRVRIWDSGELIADEAYEIRDALHLGHVNDQITHFVGLEVARRHGYTNNFRLHLPAGQVGINGKWMLYKIAHYQVLGVEEEPEIDSSCQEFMNMYYFHTNKDTGIVFMKGDNMFLVSASTAEIIRQNKDRKIILPDKIDGIEIVKTLYPEEDVIEDIVDYDRRFMDLDRKVFIKALKIFIKSLFRKGLFTGEKAKLMHTNNVARDYIIGIYNELSEKKLENIEDTREFAIKYLEQERSRFSIELHKVSNKLNVIKKLIEDTEKRIDAAKDDETKSKLTKELDSHKEQLRDINKEYGILKGKLGRLRFKIANPSPADAAEGLIMILNNKIDAANFVFTESMIKLVLTDLHMHKRVDDKEFIDNVIKILNADPSIKNISEIIEDIDYKFAETYFLFKTKVMNIINKIEMEKAIPKLRKEWEDMREKAAKAGKDVSKWTFKTNTIFVIDRIETPYELALILRMDHTTKRIKFDKRKYKPIHAVIPTVHPEWDPDRQRITKNYIIDGYNFFGNEITSYTNIPEFRKNKFIDLRSYNIINTIASFYLQPADRELLGKGVVIYKWPEDIFITKKNRYVKKYDIETRDVWSIRVGGGKVKNKIALWAMMLKEIIANRERKGKFVVPVGLQKYEVFVLDKPNKLPFIEEKVDTNGDIVYVTRNYKISDYGTKLTTEGFNIKKLKVALVRRVVAVNGKKITKEMTTEEAMKLGALPLLYEAGAWGIKGRFPKEAIITKLMFVENYRTGETGFLSYTNNNGVHKVWHSTVEHNLGYITTINVNTGEKVEIPIKPHIIHPNIEFCLFKDKESHLLRIEYRKRNGEWSISDKIKMALTGMKVMISGVIDLDKMHNAELKKVLKDVAILTTKPGSIKWGHVDTKEVKYVTIAGITYEVEIADVDVTLDSFGEQHYNNFGHNLSFREVMNAIARGEINSIKKLTKSARKDVQKYYEEYITAREEGDVVKLKEFSEDDIEKKVDIINYYGDKIVRGVGYVRKEWLYDVTDEGELIYTTIGSKLARYRKDMKEDRIEEIQNAVSKFLMKILVSPTGSPSPYDENMLVAPIVPITPLVHFPHDVVVVPDRLYEHYYNRVGKTYIKGMIYRDPVIDLMDEVAVQIIPFSYYRKWVEAELGITLVAENETDFIMISGPIMSALGGDYDGDKGHLTISVKGAEFENAMLYADIFYNGTLKHVESYADEIFGKELKLDPFDMSNVYKQSFSALNVGAWSGTARNKYMQILENMNINDKLAFKDIMLIEETGRLAEKYGTKYKSEAFIETVTDKIIFEGYSDRGILDDAAYNLMDLYRYMLTKKPALYLKIGKGKFTRYGFINTIKYVRELEAENKLAFIAKLFFKEPKRKEKMYIAWTPFAYINIPKLKKVKGKSTRIKPNSRD